jgi:sugar porter (SP) family MFS transporter
LVGGQQLGGVVSLPFCPFVAEKFGRRPSIFLGATTALIGCALQGAANGATMFILARVLLGFGVGFLMNASPLLITELAYPTQRGSYTSTFNSLWHLGALLANITTFFSLNIPNDNQWRIPGYLQGLPTIFQFLFIWAIPESPRWLVSRGRDDDAIRVLSKYHAGGDVDDKLVQFEYNEIREAIRIERETTEKLAWNSPFIGKGNQRRMLVILAIAFFSQWSGNALFSYYQTKVYNTIGITASYDQLLINIFISLWNIVISVGASMFVDKIGRRTLFLASNVGMLISYIIWTAINAAYDGKQISPAAGRGALAMWFAYQAAYAIAYSPLLVAYTVEILPYRIRSLGLTYMNFFVNIALVFNNFVNPIAFEALGWKYYIVYAVWLLFELIFVYFFVIETKGHTLEEISRLFDGEDGSDLAVASARHDDDASPSKHVKA